VLVASAREIEELEAWKSGLIDEVA